MPIILHTNTLTYIKSTTLCTEKKRICVLGCQFRHSVRKMLGTVVPYRVAFLLYIIIFMIILIITGSSGNALSVTMGMFRNVITSK